MSYLQFIINHKSNFIIKNGSASLNPSLIPSVIPSLNETPWVISLKFGTRVPRLSLNLAPLLAFIFACPQVNATTTFHIGQAIL